MILPIILLLILSLNTVTVFAEVEFFTGSNVYSKGDILLVYGTALPNETLILRLTAPDASIAKFDQITTDADGIFHYPLLVWPEESTDFPFGTYTIEVLNLQRNESHKIDVKFTSTSELVAVPVERHLNILVFAPESAAVNNPMRVFVQVTSDGLLLGNSPDNLLNATHVHTPNGKVVQLYDSFVTLHQGLYYVDYTPTQEGTYVFHAVAFSQGTTSHGSVATNVLSQDLGGISDQIIKLNSILDETSAELATLKSEIERFGSTLENASNNMDANVSSVSNSVGNIEEASSQLNSLLLPIVSSIGIIVALQIVILARRRIL